MSKKIDREMLLDSSTFYAMEGDRIFRDCECFCLKAFIDNIPFANLPLTEALRMIFSLLNVPIKRPIDPRYDIFTGRRLLNDIREYFDESEKKSIRPLIKKLRSKYLIAGQRGDKASSFLSLDQIWLNAREEMSISCSNRQLLEFISRKKFTNSRIIKKSFKKMNLVIYDALELLMGGALILRNVINARRWLNNHQIDQVQKKLSKNGSYTGFRTIPSDFLFHPPSGFNHAILLKPKILREGRFGIIINESDSSSGGSHWVAIFIDSQNKEILYFNSISCSSIIVEITDLLELYKKQKWRIYLPIINQQRGDTECGVYCLLYAKMFSEGETLTRISCCGRPDSFVEKFRTLHQL